MAPASPCLAPATTTAAAELVSGRLSPQDFKNSSYPQYVQKSPRLLPRTSASKASGGGAAAAAATAGAGGVVVGGGGGGGFAGGAGGGGGEETVAKARAGSMSSAGRTLVESPKASPVSGSKKRPSPAIVAKASVERLRPQSPLAATMTATTSNTTPQSPSSAALATSSHIASTLTNKPAVLEATSPKRSRKIDPSKKLLPALYQHCPIADLVVLISDMLGELVGLNDKIPLSGAGLTRFHSRAPPTISISDYLSRLSLHASLQPSIMLSMVYYIDILSTHYPPFVISSLTVHRFLITAATVASKGLCDSFLTNSYYAKVGGVSLMELNLLEVEFLVRVGWKIVPDGRVLGEYYKSLVERLGGVYEIEGAQDELDEGRDEDGEMGEVDVIAGTGVAES